jgi:hypothetical protein
MSQINPFLDCTVYSVFIVHIARNNQLSPKYIFLESSPQAIIGNINEVIFSGGYFYIFDNHYPAIHVFKETGAYYYSISKKGRGPGEYLAISAFDVTETGEIFIHDGTQRKIFVYSELGQKSKVYNLEYSFFEFALTEVDNQIIIRNHYVEGVLKNNFALYNLESQEFLPIDIPAQHEKFFNLPSLGFSHFFRSDKRLYFNNRFTGDIYTMNKDLKKLALRISGPHPTEEILTNWRGSLGLISEENAITVLTNIYATDDYLTLTVNRGFLLYTLVISKSNKKAILLNQSNIPGPSGNKFLGRFDIVGVYENNFLSIIPQKDIIRSDWDERVMSSDLDEISRRKLLTLDETSNHVLVLFKFNKKIFDGL